jgi:SAM-dependent methyltransferase
MNQVNQVNIDHPDIKLSAIIGALVLAWAGAVSEVAWAQTAAEPPAQHQHMGGHAGNAGSGEGFHRRFDNAEKWAKEFDNPERDAWQKPEEVLDALHLQPTSLVADIGAGTGYFSVRIAKRVPEGKIFAADVEPDMVRCLGARAEREHLANLTPVQARTDATDLPEPVDLILVVDTYHHIDDRTRYFAALQSSLRPGGRLVIIDSIRRTVRPLSIAFRLRESAKSSSRLVTC